MSVRVSTLVVAVAALVFWVAPAFATEEPPPTPPPPPHSPPNPPPPPQSPQSPQSPQAPQTPQSPLTPPGKRCVDTMRPTSKLVGKAVLRGKVTTLRGRTRDLGCSVSGLGKVRLVQVSVAELKAGRCRFVDRAGKRSLLRKCAPVRWMRATAKSDWTLRVAKRLRAGTYLVRIRAVDNSRNVEKTRSTRLTVR
jgi:hypothetical protein